MTVITERPRIHPYMTREETDRLIEWNRTCCHARCCERPAAFVYWVRRRNAHGGMSLFRFQRCQAHGFNVRERFEVFDPEAL